MPKQLRQVRYSTLHFLKILTDSIFLVFYFKDSQGKLKYIDLFARVYDDWNDYLTSNWIDPALICYSKNGHYGQDQKTNTPTFNSNILPDLAVKESPACGTLRTVGHYVKKTLAVVTPILTVASIIGIIPKLRNMKFIAKMNPMIQTSLFFFFLFFVCKKKQFKF